MSEKKNNSPMGPQRCKMKDQHVEKMVSFFKTIQLNNGGFVGIQTPHVICHPKGLEHIR
jgi:hypothetical protein